MPQLEKLLKQKQNFCYSPTLFNLNKRSGQIRLKRIFKKNKGVQITDNYINQLEELFSINNPALAFSPKLKESFNFFLYKFSKQKPVWKQGRWVYYPWLKSLVHILNDNDFQKVRTARNKNLINGLEQQKYYNAVVGIGGLSLGNSAALAIVLEGGARNVRLADFDVLSLTNLNRIRCGAQNLNLPKPIITARQIYEINPYAKVEILLDGLTEKNIKKFFSGPPKLNIVIDELDNLAVKYLIRQEAKKNRVPVIMATDNGEGGIIDIERYDLSQKTKFFHGRMGNVTYQNLLQLNKFEVGKKISEHIGQQNTSKKMKDSLSQMGKSLVSWPQLGGIALLNGSLLSYCTRKISNKQPTRNNRIIISLEDLIFNKSKRKKYAGRN
jgi:tRNA threonylcarbamoyladenosine dehydratase